MKYSFFTISILIVLFLCAQFVGLTVNKIYFESELPYGLQPPEIEPSFSPWFFVGAIVIFSVLFLMLKRFKMDILMKLWFFVAFTTCIAITLSAFIASWIAVFVALAIACLKFKEKDLYVHNLAELLVYAGVVAIFAPMLNLWAVIVLLILISVYDFVAVFITKHMVALAKIQESMGIFAGLVVANKDEVAILGGGDIAFSLLFAVVVMREFGMINSLFAIAGTAIALSLLMLIGKKKKFYPAMPFVTAGAVLGFLISLI